MDTTYSGYGNGTPHQHHIAAGRWPSPTLRPRIPPSPTPTPLPSVEQQRTENRPEVTWLFFRDNSWTSFQHDNHYKIDQAFIMGGIYVDIRDSNFPHIKSIRVFPTRSYLSYLGMKYRLSCVLQRRPNAMYDGSYS